MDMKFGTWIVTSLHRPKSLKVSPRDLVKHVLDLRGEHKVRRQNGDNDHQRIIIVSTEKVMKIVD
jgi:hypothetical protein